MRATHRRPTLRFGSSGQKQYSCGSMALARSSKGSQASTFNTKYIKNVDDRRHCPSVGEVPVLGMARDDQDHCAHSSGGSLPAFIQTDKPTHPLVIHAGAPSVSVDALLQCLFSTATNTDDAAPFRLPRRPSLIVSSCILHPPCMFQPRFRVSRLTIHWELDFWVSAMFSDCQDGNSHSW